MVHSISLWNFDENLAGGYGDPLAHAAIGEWYCQNVVTRDFESQIYMAPYGVDFSGNYDSPFPFILTCPFQKAGPHVQFHLFVLLQILLIIASSWLVGTLFLRSLPLRTCYVLAVWWCGFYVARSHQHMTLLSQIWGLELTLFAFLSLQLDRLKSVIRSSLLLSFSFAGTFQNIPALAGVTFGWSAFHLWNSRRGSWPAIARNSAIGLAVFSTVVAAFWGPMIEFTLSHGAPKLDSQRHLYNADILSPLLPYSTNLLYQWFDIPWNLDFERFNTLDPVVMVCSVLAIFRKCFWRHSQNRLLFGIAVFYFILSLGPEIRIGNEVVAQMPWNNWIFQLFPFSITRTPARMMTVSHLLLIFISFQYLRDQFEGRYSVHLPIVLAGWFLFFGPIMNQMVTFPVIRFKDFEPLKGLASIRNLSEDVVVISIPSLWAQDPSQNFHRLFHGKRVTSAYLAYPVYTAGLAEKFTADPVLGNLGCAHEVTAFKNTSLINDFNYVRNYLKRQKMTAIVVNKQMLLGFSNCHDVRLWTHRLLSQSWVHVTEENNYFLTAEVK